MIEGNDFHWFSWKQWENQEKLWLRKAFAGQIFEPQTSRLQSRAAKYSTSKFDAGLVRPLYQAVTFITRNWFDKNQKSEENLWTEVKGSETDRCMVGLQWREVSHRLPLRVLSSGALTSVVPAKLARCNREGRLSRLWCRRNLHVVTERVGSICRCYFVGFSTAVPL
jgi:hypothetical protein